MSLHDIEKAIQDIPDFPKPGIIFKDITPILQDPRLLRESIELMTAPWRQEKVELILGIESRGFIFGTAMALELGIGFIPVRKEGKLPRSCSRADYELEYGSAVIEMHSDAVKPGQKVLIVDDLLATGGTAGAAVELASAAGADIAGVQCLIELAFLNPRARLEQNKVISLITVE